MTAGIAGNMALNGLAQFSQGQRPNMRDLLLTPRNINRVAEQLAQMRGAAMKIGQLMSMDSGEILPPELAQIMARLRNDTHFMPPAQLKQVLNAQWSHNWLKSFERFDVRPIAAASIGQVHRAQLKDGRDMAIKVQYPGVAKSIDSDVANVGALMRVSGLLPKGFEIAPYLEEARKQLHEETDYAREANQLEQFSTLIAKRSGFVCPHLHRDWSTPEILSMSYVSGLPIDETLHLTQQTRDRIAERMIKLTLEEMFDFGVMQTDPNFANYLYDPETDQIVLLDFGAAREIDPKIAAQYRDLIAAGLGGNRPRIAQVAQDIGFFAEDTQDVHRDQIVDMIAFVFQTLAQARPFDFTHNDLSTRMQAMGMQLAESGFIPPPLPIDILLIQRKLGGMFLLAKRLGARVDAATLLEHHVARAATRRAG
ncbi:MAG: AarF/ABC1/UbiB kinase family protein [Roseobacter sp.]